jgi:hypothetical protein
MTPPTIADCSGKSVAGVPSTKMHLFSIETAAPFALVFHHDLLTKKRRQMGGEQEQEGDRFEPLTQRTREESRLAQRQRRHRVRPCSDSTVLRQFVWSLGIRNARAMCGGRTGSTASVPSEYVHLSALNMLSFAPDRTSHLLRAFHTLSRDTQAKV